MYRIFLNFAKRCVLSCLSNVYNIKLFHRAVFFVLFFCYGNTGHTCGQYILLDSTKATPLWIICYIDTKVYLENTPLEWRILHILTSEDIDDFTDIKFVS